MKRLFIGGPADGERIDMPKERTVWDIMEPFDCVSVAEANQSVSRADLTLSICRYKKMPLCGNSHTFYVMAAENMNLDAVIRSLVMRYLKTDVGKSKESPIDPKKLDAENLLDRMAEAS